MVLQTFAIHIINACPVRLFLSECFTQFLLMDQQEPLKAQATAIETTIDAQFMLALNAYNGD